MTYELVAPTWKLLVRVEHLAVDKEKKTESGIIYEIIDNRDAELEQEGNCFAYIVSVGPVAGKYQYWPDEKKQEFHVGQCVFIHRFAGSLVPTAITNDSKHMYRIINDLDVQLIIAGKEEKLS